MCKFCEKYNFNDVGCDLESYGGTLPTLFFRGNIASTPKEDERFKFCPMCGEKLKEENFK